MTDFEGRLRLDRLEDDVWQGIARRERRTRRLTAACGALAFAAVFAGSYGAGSIQGGLIVQHLAMTGELSEGGEFG